MHILIFGIPLYEGMAGSVRVRNLILPISKKIGGKISNVYFSLQADNCVKSLNDNSMEINLNFKSLLSIFNYLKSSIIFLSKNYIEKEENVFYLYETPDLKTVLPLIYAKIIGYKIVLDIVEDNSLAASFGGFINRLRIKSGSFFLKNLQFIIDLNVVISSHLENLVMSLNNDISKVLYIPVTMDFEKFSELKVKPSNKPNRIFYGGSFGKKDGLDNLIYAFEHVCDMNSNARLILTGKGENKADFDNVMTIINNSVYSKRIEYKGFLSSVEYSKVISNCDIFCVIRDNSGAASSGFPSKLAEFLATGKAVIVSRVGDIPVFLEDKVNAVLVEPGSIDQLASSILYLLDNPTLIDKIGNEGQKVAFKFFNNITESDKLYRRILAL